jgi:L-seryl-tRNA(Ser) seleniumtransferase
MQLRDLPSVDRVMASDRVAALVETYSRDWVVEVVREQLDHARQKVRQGGTAPATGELADDVCRQIADMNRISPRRVINATGVVIHTNLGRAPLSMDAIVAMTQASQGYSDLELDLDTGRRGSRQAHLQSLLRRLTGAEAALAVNNNASAVMLGLSALASGKEVIVPRGEAVEIGGGFRVPDVLEQSGARLVDVGTTNRTYVRDYENAVTENTGAFLKVHASNFRVEGFTATVEPGELVALGDRLGVPVLHDVGSGALLPTELYGLAHEPTPQESVAAGMGLVFFSGDKLLGGPQAGIVVGKAGLVQRLERHPLARAMRIDKLSMTALTATLLHYLRGEAVEKIPVWRMISAPENAVRERAERWRSAVRCGEVVPSRSAIGGGSLPGETLPTWALAIRPEEGMGGVESLTARLREGTPPVMTRIEGDRALLDPRTVLPEEEGGLLRVLGAVLPG